MKKQQKQIIALIKHLGIKNIKSIIYNSEHDLGLVYTVNQGDFNELQIIVDMFLQNTFYLNKDNACWTVLAYDDNKSNKVFHVFKYETAINI